MIYIHWPCARHSHILKITGTYPEFHLVIWNWRLRHQNLLFFFKFCWYCLVVSEYFEVNLSRTAPLHIFFKEYNFVYSIRHNKRVIKNSYFVTCKRILVGSIATFVRPPVHRQTPVSHQRVTVSNKWKGTFWFWWPVKHQWEYKSHVFVWVSVADAVCLLLLAVAVA